MKRFKEWWKENWENRSFRYAVTVVVMIVLAILTNIYVYFRDRGRCFRTMKQKTPPSIRKAVCKLSDYDHDILI